jgi:hypothetical protein
MMIDQKSRPPGFSDAQLSMIMHGATPISRRDRGEFLVTVIAELSSAITLDNITVREAITRAQLRFR